MAFITGLNKARCLSHPLLHITLTADANKEERNAAFVKKGEKKDQRGRREREEKTITGSEGVRHNDTDEKYLLVCNVW